MKLGKIQLHVLRTLSEGVSKGEWYWGVGWYWGSEKKTEQLLDALVGKGLVARTEAPPHAITGQPHPSKWVWKITPEGKRVTEATWERIREERAALRAKAGIGPKGAAEPANAATSTPGRYARSPK